MQPHGWSATRNIPDNPYVIFMPFLLGVVSGHNHLENVMKSLLTGIAAMLLLSACQNTAEGMKDDTRAASDHISHSVEENREHDRRGY